VLTSKRQCTLGKGVCLCQVASQHLRFTQGEITERLKGYRFRCSRLFHCLHE
jgi:hypothetical protein